MRRSLSEFEQNHDGSKARRRRVPRRIALTFNCDCYPYAWAVPEHIDPRPSHIGDRLRSATPPECMEPRTPQPRCGQLSESFALAAESFAQKSKLESWKAFSVRPIYAHAVNTHTQTPTNIQSQRLSSGLWLENVQNSGTRFGSDTRDVVTRGSK